MEEKGLSNYRVALDLEISDSLLGKWRNGKTVPSVTALSKLADYLNVSTDYLLGRDDVPNRKEQG